uniref:Uncharacterized protein n=1 Tax=Oryza barthii TaxID=65489 RepID=A0A0D3G8Y8_9ORYZ
MVMGGGISLALAGLEEPNGLGVEKKMAEVVRRGSFASAAMAPGLIGGDHSHRRGEAGEEVVGLQLPQVLVVSRRPPRRQKLANHALILGATFLASFAAVMRCSSSPTTMGSLPTPWASSSTFGPAAAASSSPADLLVSRLAPATSSVGRPAEHK